MQPKKVLKPKDFFGGTFNIIDEKKFQQALQLLQESLGKESNQGGIPFFASDNVITWNRNLSFLREDFYLDILRSEDSTFIEKSCIWRLYILLYFAELCKDVNGDFVELGCHNGTTAKRVTEKIPFASLGKHYWLYDLFSWNEGDEHTHMAGHDNPNMHMDAINRFADQPYVSVIKGSVPESFTQGFPAAIAFAHIDMNSPNPEKMALTKVLPKLSPGGCIIFDDYGWWGYSDQKIALDPIAESEKLKILELPTGQGLLIKSRLSD